MARHRISRARLLDVERHAPRPFVPLTIIRQIVDPSDAGPVYAEIACVWRRRRNHPPVEVMYPDCSPDTDFGSMTDDEIAQLKSTYPR